MRRTVNCFVAVLMVALSCRPAAAFIAARGFAVRGGGSWGAVGRVGAVGFGYHPPVVVHTYSAGCYNCGGWSTAGAAAAGVVVGAVAGAAIANARDAQANEDAYAAGVAAGSAYAMGAIYPTLPDGCTYQAFGAAAYYHCPAAWFSPAYGANGVYYRVVPAP